MVKRISIETVHAVRDTCLCLASQRAARLLARRFDRAFQELGITNNQFSLLMTLTGVQPPALSGLAEFLGMDRTTLTAALKALQRRGLVSVAVDAGDARVKRPQLTPAGLQLVKSALPVWRAEHTALEKQLVDADAHELRRLLAAVR